MKTKQPATWADFKKWRDKSQYHLDVAIGDMVLDARTRCGWTQAQLAKKVKTNQSAIARLENSGTLPSLTFLKRVMDAMETDLFFGARPRK